jgi:hypothetical protein
MAGVILKIDPNKLAAADLAAISVCRDIKVPQPARQQSDVFGASSGGKDIMVADDIRAIVSSLRPEDRDYIRNLSENELIRLHRTFGQFLRNAFRSGSYGELFRYCSERETKETRSFDSISVTAIRLIWECICSKPNDVEPGAAADGGA